MATTEETGGGVSQRPSPSPIGSTEDNGVAGATTAVDSGANVPIENPAVGPDPLGIPIEVDNVRASLPLRHLPPSRTVSHCFVRG